MKRDSNFKNDRPILYLVPTPIGNIKEMSPRAISIINEMDYIAAEDTRVSGKLLNLLEIKKPLISCHEHNEKEASEKIISLLLEGKKVAYMSDAGMPCISDPGYLLVNDCLLHNIYVSPISGPNAALNALISSGINPDRFTFYGFLNPKESVRKEELRKLVRREETLIFYEAPHRIDKTLKNMYEIFGRRKACIARELTKIHEEFIRGNLEDFISLNKETLKGEMVIIVEGCDNEIIKKLEPQDALKLIQSFIDTGMSAKDAISKAASLLNMKKNDLYSLYHRN